MSGKLVENSVFEFVWGFNLDVTGVIECLLFSRIFLPMQLSSVNGNHSLMLTNLTIAHF